MLLLRHANIKISIFIALVLLIFGYTYFQLQNLYTGPVITISGPQNGAEFTHSLIEVTGSTSNISDINLNDRHMFIDEVGDFSEKILLSPGYNIVTLRGEDRFGRKTQKVLELVYN